MDVVFAGIRYAVWPQHYLEIPLLGFYVIMMTCCQYEA